MPRRTDFASQIAAANRRLKVGQLGLQIEQRGQRLSLRGTFPPKPDSDRLHPYQQRLSLGIPATPAGLKQIEQDAKVIAAQLITREFRWSDYQLTASGTRLSQVSLAEQLEAFEAYFFTQAGRSRQDSSNRSTWEKAYLPYLRQLLTTHRDRPRLTLPEAILATVKATRPNTRSRQLCCTALGAFADFLELSLPISLKDFWGNYGTGKTQARTLPSDAEILAILDRIPNPHWRFVYGLMATYGLRNHEVFFCDCTAMQAGDREAPIRVLATTKTGEHEVWPFHPDWVDRLHLRDGELPPVNTDLSQTTLQRIGQQVSLQFRRYDIPFKPYDLRHAWAVRTIHVGLPDTVAARMMGHSVAIHTRTYHRWISHRDQAAAVRQALAQAGTPRSPR